MRSRIALSAVHVAAAVITLLAQPPSLRYPAARKDGIVNDYFGTRVADPYRWMEELGSPEVKAWVDAENAVTFAYLGTLADRPRLQSRITKLWNYSRVSAPAFEGGRWFYRRNTGLQRQSVIFSRTVLDGPETLVLDPNVLSPDGSVALSGFAPSPDGRHVAYGQAEGGSDWSTYYVRELQTGRQLPDTIRWMKFTNLAWTKDGRGFFYGRYPEPPARQVLQAAVHDKKIYYHVLGTPQSADRLVYERPEEPMLFIDLDLDETGRYLFLSTNKGTSNKNELFVKDLGDPKAPRLDAPVAALYPGHTAQYAPLGVVQGMLYVLTDRDAPRKKVIAVPMERPEVANWRTVVPEGPHSIETAVLIAGQLALSTLEDVASAVWLYALDGSRPVQIATPGLGAVGGPSGRFDRPEVFYSFTSPLSPNTVFRFDQASGRSTAFEPPTLTFDPSVFETNRVFVTSKDGTRVPMFVTKRRDLKRDGTNPTMMYGYGGFDIAEQPTFRPDVIAWLEHGGVWVTVNMRGGSEYGEAWHEGGMREHKQNVFDDFIAAAESMVRAGWTSPNRLGASGGSNGGLLVGAVMEQRPDLFAVALPEVGVMDMLRYHRFTGGSAWATEYGSSDDAQAFAYLVKYSPLHNIKPGTCYPATLVITADHDDRVVPSHSFKFTAALQAAQGCSRPVLIRVETQASHGYRPTDKRIAELADQWSFAAGNMKKN
jgi:prolyl oligopeptidase